MKTQFTGFGRLDIDGQTYTEDVVINKGRITPREKDASRTLKGEYGHTPLSEREPIPWDCTQLIVGTGAQGRLPVTEAVRREARERRVELVELPTAEACALVNNADLARTNVILHITC